MKYRLDIDEVFSLIDLSTRYDIGDEGHGIIVADEDLNKAIHEITERFENLLFDAFHLDDDETEEE